MNALLLAIFSLNACAHTPPSAQSPASLRASSEAPTVKPRCDLGTAEAALPSMAELPSEALIAKYGTGLDAYQRQDGVWLPQAPVLVNEDFDFAVAMSLEAIGAGIAAKKRIDGNAKSAGELSNVTLADGEREKLDALRACGVHVFGVIWTKGEARELRVVTDLFDTFDTKRRVTDHKVKAAPWDAEMEVRLAP